MHSCDLGLALVVTAAILDREMHTEAAAARLLRVAPSTLHWRLEGRPPRYRPVIRVEPTGSRTIARAEFVEAGLLRSYRREDTRIHLRYLWAGHPAIAGGSVHHVQAVSFPVTPSPPVALPGSAEPCCRYMYCCTPETPKAPSWQEKGLDLRKLVAGAGFEPATSGL